MNKTIKVKVSSLKIIGAFVDLQIDASKNPFPEYWKNFVELDAEVVEEEKEEHCNKCNIALGMSNPPSYTCWSTCPCHSKSEENNKEWRRYDISAPTQKIEPLKDKYVGNGMYEATDERKKINEIIAFLNSHGK